MQKDLNAKNERINELELKLNEVNEQKNNQSIKEAQMQAFINVQNQELKEASEIIKSLKSSMKGGNKIVTGSALNPGGSQWERKKCLGR